jgi:predicted transcriptional regulator
VFIDKSGIGDFELTLKFDPEKKGLAKILRNYQAEALKSLWKNSEKGLTSREVHEYVNGKIDSSISRASIINFLKLMADERVLDYETRPGKGGMRPIYTPRMNESEFKKYVAKTVIASLLKDFPEETKTAISQLTS